MVECPFAPTCPFFSDRMKNMPAAAELMKKRYCFDDHKGCARFIVWEKMGMDRVPEDLYPNQREKAMKIANA